MTMRPDFVARQFIVLTKKLRKELRKSLSDLQGALQNQTRAVSKYYERENQQQNTQPAIQVVAELHTPEDVERTHTTNENRQYRLQRWNTIGTWLAFFAVAIYAALTYFQLRDFDASVGLSQIMARQSRVQAAAATSAAKTAKDVSDNATKSFHISERPYVTIVTVDWDTPLEASKQIGLTVLCDNSGRSPALKVTYATTAFVNGKRIGDPIVHEGAAVIAAGHPTKKHFFLNFSDADVAQIKNSPDTFKVQGDIRYTDIFGEWHPTTWCSIYDGKQGAFKFCPEGNDVR